ncbi:MAG: tetratricopeptide repeat protein [Syntrophomonadaceae bacterium]
MKRIFVFSMTAILLVLSLSAFQCSSTEMTSAKLYIQQKNYPKAMEALQKELQKNPKNDEAHYFLGYLYSEQGDYTKMMDAFNKSLAISNKFAKNIDDTRKFDWMNSFNKGVAFFNKATKAQAQDSVKMYYDKAVKAFNDGITTEPDSADTYKNLAFALLSANRTEDAVQPLEKLRSIKKSADSYKLLGQIYNQQGATEMNKYKQTKVADDSLKAMQAFDKAVNVLEEGRKLFPEDQDILLHLSNAYISANKASVAMETFKTGVEKDPQNQYYRYNYGTLLLQAADVDAKAGNYDKAISEYQVASDQFTKAMEIDPKYHNAIFNLGVAYVKWGTALREQADKQNKENPEYKNKYQQALPYLQQVTELKPDDPIAWETLAKVYAVLGMNKESQEAFTKADQLKK